MMARHLTFKQAALIDRARAVSIAVPEGQAGEVIRVRAETVARRLDMRLSDFIEFCVEIGLLADANFLPPDQFCTDVILRAAPNLAQLTERAATMKDDNDE